MLYEQQVQQQMYALSAGCACWLNREQRYRQITPQYAATYGYKCVEEARGCSLEQTPCSYYQCTTGWRQINSQVMQTQRSIYFVSIARVKWDEWKIALACSRAVRNKHYQVTGTYTVIHDLLDYFKPLAALLTYCGAVSCLSEDIERRVPPINLNIREQQLLFWLLRGRNNREIGRLLPDYHRRTIEDTLAVLKRKFTAPHKAALIDAAVDAGYFYSIPDTLLQAQAIIRLPEV